MIADNLHIIQQKIKLCKKGAPTLIAVSKQQSDETLDEALTLGLRVFGENRVQEAQVHWEHRRVLYPDLQLHLIGPLQSNKAKDAVALFDCIHTVDRISIVDALSEQMKKQNKNIPCFIQVNTGDEPQKAGIAPAELPKFFNYCWTAGLDIIGLMCIPPVAEAAGIHFTFLKKLAERHGLTELSMGMSDDFETAIKAGATHIRIGSALFGAR